MIAVILIVMREIKYTNKIRDCLICGKKFQCLEDYKNRKQIYCSKFCYWKSLKDKKKSKDFCQRLKEIVKKTWQNPKIREKRIQGMKAWKRTKEYKRKIGETNKKVWKNKSEAEREKFRKMARARQIRLLQNPKYKENLRNAHKGRIGYWRNKKRPEIAGNNCHLWRGGITKLVKKIRESIEYKQWRKAIFEKDNFTCWFCKVKGKKIQADHYPKSFSQIIRENKIKNLQQAMKCQELWDISNGRTLCIDCHKKTDNYLRKPEYNNWERFSGKTVKKL